MKRQIGAVLARTFREVCEKSNARARKDILKVSPEEIKSIEELLKKIDNDKVNMRKELAKYFELEGET